MPDFVKLPSGLVINASRINAMVERDDEVRYFMGSDQLPWAAEGKDASALRAFMRRVPALRTEAQSDAFDLLARMSLTGKGGVATMHRADGTTARVVVEVTRPGDSFASPSVWASVSDLRNGEAIFTIGEVCQMDFEKMEAGNA